ncbi:MAG: hypothetical protein R3F61_27440 [Myxococcota bacterium]
MSQDSPRPAEIRIGPVSVPWAVVGVGLAIVGSILVLGGLGVAGSVMTNAPHTDCALGASEALGWVELDVGRMSKISGHHTLGRDGVVLAEKTHGRTRVCTLPRGSRIEVRDRPDRGRDGTWLRVYGDAVVLPR